MMFSTADFAAAVVAYLIGSLSFAVIVSRALNLPDPHSYGCLLYTSLNASLL